ncbi:hypothetical protein [Pseudovibrio sp. SPO723]|uniref:hypothetical protein n=1 Tax=Nesiotobacter zosterae TaxID=392721 RepID=UPI0029C386DE|nr:hypothetical protein [Pseudovibrio sp. SPO723]MDX5595659.1 hypothetical protein [Pseudovibrio sp. SPO723]
MGLFTSEQIKAISERGAKIARAWEFRFKSETVHVWNGNVNRRFGDEPQKWIGMRGHLQGPDFPFSATGENQSGFFRVHGLPEHIKHMMWDYQSEVYGRYVIEYTLFLDGQTLDLIGPKAVNQIYVMRRLRSARSGAGLSGSAPGYTLSIMVASLFEKRAEAAFGRYTEADQKGRYPGMDDRIFNYATVLARGTPIKLI